MEQIEEICCNLITDVVLQCFSARNTTHILYDNTPSALQAPHMLYLSLANPG